MTIVPHNKFVLCTKSSTIEFDTNGLFVSDNKSFNTYRIEKLGDRVDSEWHVGDSIVVNSTGTHIQDTDVDYYIFDTDSIVARLV